MNSHLCYPCGAGVIERLSPVGGAGISIMAEADPSLAMPKSAAEERLAEQLRTKLSTAGVLL